MVLELRQGTKQELLDKQESIHKTIQAIFDKRIELAQKEIYFSESLETKMVEAYNQLQEICFVQADQILDLEQQVRNLNRQIKELSEPKPEPEPKGDGTGIFKLAMEALKQGKDISEIISEEQERAYIIDLWRQIDELNDEREARLAKQDAVKPKLEEDTITEETSANIALNSQSTSENEVEEEEDVESLFGFKYKKRGN